MQILQTVLTFLGPPYKTTIIDGENVIYRKLENGVESLKDILGYYATKYQNLTAEIQVEREDQII